MRKLLLTALLCLTICACRGQYSFHLGQHVTVGNWNYFIVNDVNESYKMAYTESQIMNFDRGNDKSSMVWNLHESGRVTVDIHNTIGLFTNDPIGDTVLVRFDDGPLEKWEILRNKKGNQHSIILSYADVLYARMKTTHRLGIRAVFDDGKKWMFFDVDGININTLQIRNDTW